ncbi:hypothetical protein J2T13_003453 [Paenibacillus sp. DS2015]
MVATIALIPNYARREIAFSSSYGKVYVRVAVKGDLIHSFILIEMLVYSLFSGALYSARGG